MMIALILLVIPVVWSYVSPVQSQKGSDFLDLDLSDKIHQLEDSEEDCVFPFTFDGVEYNECAPGTSQPHPWCATSFQSDGKNIDSWKVCSVADDGAF